MTDCYVLLQTGGKIILESGTGFLLLTDCVAPDETIVGDSWHQYDPYAQRALQEQRLAQERQRIKEDEVIRLRLEAQDLLMRKREAETLNEIRRFAALEKQYLAAQHELQLQLVALIELQKIAVKRRNNVIMLLLAAACPFTSLSLN